MRVSESIDEGAGEVIHGVGDELPIGINEGGSGAISEGGSMANGFTGG